MRDGSTLSHTPRSQMGRRICAPDRKSSHKRMVIFKRYKIV